MTSPFNAFHVRTYTASSDKITYIAASQAVTQTRIFNKNTGVTRRKEILPILTASKKQKFSEIRHVNAASNKIAN